MARRFETTKNGMLTLHTTGMTCREDIVVNVDVSSNLETHKITIASDQTSGDFTLLTENQFVKDHYQEDGFMVQFINLDVKASGVTQTGYGFCGNRPLLPSGDSYVFGGSYYRTSGLNGSYTYKNAYTRETVYGIPKVTTDGSVYVICNATRGVLTAGDYLVILSVAEVQV